MKSYFTFVGAIRDKSGKIKEYKLKSVSTGKIVSLTGNNIKLELVRGNIKVDGLSVKSGRLYIDKRYREVEHKRDKGLPVDLKVPAVISIITGNGINKELKINGYSRYKHRWYVNDILEWEYNSNTMDMYAIYGIRRTGKTVSMWHIIEYLLRNGEHSNNIAYINIEDSIDIEELLKVLDKLPQKYIFIDEITRLYNFVTLSNILADRFAVQQKKIVVAGTDSLAISVASSDRLFGRVRFARSNLISFNEYIMLFDKVNKSDAVASFIANGGTTYDLEYRSIKSTHSTVNTAIIGNIVNTISKNRVDKYNDLKELNNVQLAYSIYCLMGNVMSTKSADKDLWKHTKLSETVKLLLQRVLTDFNDTQVKKISKTSGITGKHMNLVKQAMAELDILDVIMNFAYDTDKTVKETSIEPYCNIPGMFYGIKRALSMDSFTSDDMGILLENMVIQQCVVWKGLLESKLPSWKDSGYSIGYARYKDKTDNKTKEIDIVIRHTVGDFEDRKTITNLIEVKHSNKSDIKHCKNFKSESMYELFGDNTNNIIVYMGENTTISVNVGNKSKEVKFINVYDFITDIGKWIK